MAVRAPTESAHRAALSRVGRRERIVASDLLGLDRMVPGGLLEIRIGGIP
jgi:hypothetical protein